MPKLKACRVHCSECLRSIDRIGFDFAGVHAINSVELHSLGHAEQLSRAKAYMQLKVALVLLTKVQDHDAVVRAMHTTGYEWVQLHSHWRPEALAHLREELPPETRIISLFDPSKMPVEVGLELLGQCDYLIVDHSQGGTGLPVDRSSLESMREVIPFNRCFLSGGLTSSSVREVIEDFDPFAVDVQSDLLGATGEQDYRRMANFRAAAKGERRQSYVPREALPLRKYDSSLWKSIDPEVATREDLVAKLNLIEALESRSHYKVSGAPYFTRIQASLAQLENLSADVRPEWIQAALVLFANVTYLPQDLLQQSWRSLYLDLDRLIPGGMGPQPLSRMHLLENDPSGMAGLFCHVNRLEGRLDAQTIARIEGVDKIADLLLGLANPVTADHCAHVLRGLLVKSNWVLLVDKTLSGHSLRGDLERLIFVANRGTELGYPLPRIWVLAQVATKQAFEAVADLVESFTGDIELHAAVNFGPSDSLSATGSNLIRTPAIRDAARELCMWFAEHVIAQDRGLDRMRARSGDGLAFGYRNCGLALADHDNCPTDSLPLLWYAGKPANYQGPYPRVHSRIGDQSSEKSQDKWRVLTNGSLAANLEALKSGGIL